jgi:hypothetical protein
MTLKGLEKRWMLILTLGLGRALSAALSAFLLCDATPDSRRYVA